MIYQVLHNNQHNKLHETFFGLIYQRTYHGVVPQCLSSNIETDITFTIIIFENSLQQ
jgi:hypothetical protein